MLYEEQTDPSSQSNFDWHLQDWSMHFWTISLDIIERPSSSVSLVSNRGITNLWLGGVVVTSTIMRPQILLPQIRIRNHLWELVCIQIIDSSITDNIPVSSFFGPIPSINGCWLEMWTWTKWLWLIDFANSESRSVKYWWAVVVMLNHFCRLILTQYLFNLFPSMTLKPLWWHST